MSPTEKQFADVIFAIGEALHQQDARLAGLEADLVVVKGFLSKVMNPSNPAEALARIEAHSKRARAKAPGAERRAAISEQIDLLKLSEKHGGPKDA